MFTHESSSSTPIWGFFPRLTGIHSSIYQRSSPSFQRQLKLIGIGMLFTAIFSGTLLALSIYYYTESWYFAITAFAVAGIFTLLLDRKLVTATVSLGIGGRFVRIALVFAWIILHTTMIETVLFTEDLQAHLTARQQPQVTQIHDQYDEARRSIDDRREALLVDIDRSHEIIRAADHKEQTEVDGNGVTGVRGVGDMTLYLQEKTEQIEARENAVIVEKEQALLRLDQESTDAKSSRNNQLDKLPEIDSYGPLVRSEMLHDILWNRGNVSMKLIALAIMLIIATVELFPLIGKGLANFQEYYALHDNDMLRCIAKDKMGARLKDEVMAVELAHRTHLEKLQVREEYFRKELTLRLEEALARFRHRITSIQALEDEVKRADRESLIYNQDNVRITCQEAIRELSTLLMDEQNSNLNHEKTGI